MNQYLWAIQFALGLYIALYTMFGNVRRFTHKIILFVLIELFAGLNFLIEKSLIGLRWLYGVNAQNPRIATQNRPSPFHRIKDTTPDPQSLPAKRFATKSTIPSEPPTPKNPNTIIATENELEMWTKNPDVKVHEN